nr:EOG090X0MUO [Eurycercus lamellatus]
MVQSLSQALTDLEKAKCKGFILTSSNEIQVPSYDALNVQIKSHDYTILETFSGYIHKTALNMGIEVEDCWAAPAKKYNIQTFKPSTTLIENQYHLNIYERNVQVVDLPSTTAPIFFHIIQAALPEGVNMTIKPHEDIDEEQRYIPDEQLKQLKEQLDSIGNPVDPAKQGKWIKNKQVTPKPKI